MTQENSTKFFGGVYESPQYNVRLAVKENSDPIVVPEGTGIYEDSEHRLIYFPVAGYTKSVTFHTSNPNWDMTPAGITLKKFVGVNRQKIIKEFSEKLSLTVSKGSRAACNADVKIKLVPEPHNPYDKDAILVMAREGRSETLWPLGYVPSKIATVMAHRREWYKDEDFLLVFRLDENNKHIIPQLCIHYEEPQSEKSRFAKIEYE